MNPVQNQADQTHEAYRRGWDKKIIRLSKEYLHRTNAIANASNKEAEEDNLFKTDMPEYIKRFLSRLFKNLTKNGIDVDNINTIKQLLHLQESRKSIKTKEDIEAVELAESTFYKTWMANWITK